MGLKIRKFDDQPAEVREKCATIAERRGWTAQIAWDKACIAGEILQITPEEGIEFLLSVYYPSSDTE